MNSDRPNAEAPKVTVVMITRDRRDEACGAVERLLALPERPRVIVVDNASTDGTTDALRAIGPAVAVVPLDRNAGAAGRNVGVAKASTPYVAFADDDSAWERGALARGVEILEAHPGLGLLAARVLVGVGERLDPVCAQMAASPLPGDPALPGRPVLGFVACAAIVRRSAFMAAGGFDERYGVGGEEGPLAIDMATQGWALAYVEDLTVRHWPSPRRDHRARRRVVARNALWLAWSRRHWPSAARTTARSLRLAVTDSAVRAGVLEAAGGLYQILRERRPVDARLERQLQMID